MILRHDVQGFLPRARPDYGHRQQADRIPGLLGYVPGAMTQHREPDPTLVTGASGYVGGFLIEELLRRGRRVRALARDPAKASQPPAVDVRGGDAVSGRGLREALEGCRTAYYLIHSMGRGSDDDFARRDREAAVNFGEAARDAGVERVVYLGGLGPTGEDASEHLRSRHEVAELLRQRVPGFVYVRAAMIIGPGSASFEMLRHLVSPTAGDDHPALGRHALAARGDRRRGQGAGRRGRAREPARGGPARRRRRALTYREMMARAAPRARAPLAEGRQACRCSRRACPRTGCRSSRRSRPGLVRPLVDGMKSEMVVEQRPPAPASTTIRWASRTP